MDVVQSIRSLVRARLPAAVVEVMVETHGDPGAATRFFTVIHRFFADMCALITYMCEDGVDGLRVIFKAFMVLYHSVAAVPSYSLIFH